MLKDTDPDDGTTTEATVYTAETVGAKACCTSFENGGHTWLGCPLYLSERLIGKASQDFDASEEIWNFFMAYPPRMLEK